MVPESWRCDVSELSGARGRVRVNGTVAVNFSYFSSFSFSDFLRPN